MIYRYGTIWLLWILVNRFLCEQLQMADAFLNFAQIAGKANKQDHGDCVFANCKAGQYLKESTDGSGCQSCVDVLRVSSLRAVVFLTGSLGGFDVGWPKGIQTFLDIGGLLDFDIDVTGYALLRCFSSCNLF